MRPELNLSDVEIVEFAELDIAILTHRGSPRTLPLSIQNFVAWRKANQLSPVNSRTFNIIYNDPRQATETEYRFGLGVEIKSNSYALAENMHFETIPSCRCAYFRHIGPEHLLSHSLEFLFTHWLNATQNLPGKFPLFFERVSFGPQVLETEMITDIYLPLN
ncbi:MULTISPECIES: AraC family transcriptional regulator [Aliiglaciecola]|uniref:AraC family transcriptional regulator n=1 Tax=Aliiglaciecola TaxID=1406885 RepID=UPI001C09F404|nr:MULTISPECIES: GyrI-like domain-containing protein [Aliiglaciecola]MBU2878787.1 GyrI-like domain-containing protein [Aliiglaciecola lipolytica]MDO6711315.1 GyrI-like domain-containing protein [Aliiglaciecola sp. 2_MG-2023]MDO6752236.1 GyrI-like domain-containing protein [Aliiglaciecola sp. 1_MG-2023]